MVTKVITADSAVAHGAKLARVEVIPAFPITPQTIIVEELADFVNNGELDADFINTDSEHSALSIAVGASAGGVRAFTATSSQGLAYMHEMLYSTSPNRLPIVMAIVNRSLGAAAGIWLEHNDTMPELQSGWMQVYVEDNQEALDMVIQGYKIAEDERVQLPIMVCLDGFVLSHTVERVEVPDQGLIDEYLPKYRPYNILDPGEPMTWNPVTPPDFATEMRYQLDRAMESAKTVIPEVDESYARLTGRKYGGLLETYQMEDAEMALITLGTATSTARVVVDELREQGKKAGVIKMRFMRPFPINQLRELATNLKALGVFDRALALNGYGPVFTEVRNALYGMEIPITDHIGGLGGRDLLPSNLRSMYEIVERSGRGEKVRDCSWHGLRGEQV